MFNYKFSLIFVIICSFLEFSYGQQIYRESILDKKPSIEDSIYYHIDSLPPLCEELGMNAQYIDIGDCKLYCEIEGTGVPLVLINGGPGGTHHCFHPWFNRAKDYCKVIYYDQRGCGKSDYEEGSGYTFRQAVDDLDKLRKKLNIKKWVVCGYSYGGALAQYYVITYPEHTSGIVLIGAAPLLGSDIPKGSRQQLFICEEEKDKIKEIYSLYRKGELNDFQLLYNKELNGDWKRQSFYKPTKDEIVRASLYEWKHDRDFRQKVGWGYQQYNFKDIFASCPVPTLMCEGKWDLTWVEEKKDIFQISQPHAQFALFENAGHTIFSEDTDLFFSTLKDFINSLKDIPKKETTNWKKQIRPLIDTQERFFSQENKFIRLIETKGLEKGIEFYTIYKKKFPNKKLFSESAMSNLGYSLWNKEDNQSAIKVFEMNLKEYPKSASILENLGDGYLKLKNPVMAKEFYLKSLEIEPNNNWVKQSLAKCNAE